MAPPTARFEMTTALTASAEEVWDFAVEPDGINYELGPWVSMTLPRGVDRKTTIDDIEPGVPVGRCWIKLAGIPVDYDDLCLDERGPGYRFLERSSMGSARAWQHEREIVGTGARSCKVTDRLEIELRAPLRVLGGTRVAGRIIRVLFTHRHRRLRERWGTE